MFLLMNTILSALYRPISACPLPEYHAEGRYFEHIQSGCLVYHVACPDRENLFAFCFKTPSNDSSGVAHIMEHSVLCGSERFPLKEPFVDLLKSSAKTFLNAITFPDKTIYPAASAVPADLFNIMEVYGDAVFSPLLRATSFRQEGHRLMFSPNNTLTRSGIVYNEMKGAYSTCESIVGAWNIRGLFSDTPYQYEAGGLPEEIARLTYDRFRQFHRDHYYPANCRIFLYGDIPTDRYLEFIDRQFLGKFSRRAPAGEIVLQRGWSKPRRITRRYPTMGAPSNRATTVSISWLLHSVEEIDKAMAIEILDELLMGHSGSPLRKAIAESPLVEDISPVSGAELDLRQAMFTIAVRGVREGDEERVETFILDQLARFAREGFADDLVAAALQVTQFDQQEIRSLFGLALAQRAFRGWLHGAAPEQTLAIADALERVCAAIQRDSNFFPAIIKEAFLDNPHRLTVIARPDSNYGRHIETEDANKLAEIENSLPPSERNRIDQEETELRQFQHAADDPTIHVPRLSLADMPKTITEFSAKEHTIASNAPLLHHPCAANGIVYLTLSFDLGMMPSEYLMAMPLWCASLVEVGADTLSYEALARKLALCSGDFSLSLTANLPLGADRPRPLMIAQISCLERHVDEAIDLIGSIFTSANLENHRRIGDIAIESRNEMAGAIFPGGNRFAMLRSSAISSATYRLKEAWQGIDQFLWLNNLNMEDEATLKQLSQTMRQIHNHAVFRGALRFGIACSDEAFPAARDALERLVDRLEPRPRLSTDATTIVDETANPYIGNQFIASSSPVNYIGVSMAGDGIDKPTYAANMLIGHLLRTGALWETVRMKGGAYGATAVVDGLTGQFCMLSYRDPNTAATIDAFRQALDSFVSIDPEELEQAQIALIAKENKPFSPSSRGALLINRWLFRIDNALRQRVLTNIRDIAPGDLREAAQNLATSFDDASICLLGRNEAIDEMKRKYENIPHQTIALPL